MTRLAVALVLALHAAIGASGDPETQALAALERGDTPALRDTLATLGRSKSLRPRRGGALRDGGRAAAAEPRVPRAVRRRARRPASGAGGAGALSLRLRARVALSHEPRSPAPTSRGPAASSRRGATSCSSPRSTRTPPWRRTATRSPPSSSGSPATGADSLFDQHEQGRPGNAARARPARARGQGGARRRLGEHRRAPQRDAGRRSLGYVAAQRPAAFGFAFMGHGTASIGSMTTGARRPRFAELQLPASLLVVTYIGVPRAADVTPGAQGDYAIIAPHGPNDGMTLLADALVPQGVTLVERGLDHYFAASDIDRRIAALAQALLETLETSAPGQNCVHAPPRRPVARACPRARRRPRPERGAVRDRHPAVVRGDVPRFPRGHRRCRARRASALLVYFGQDGCPYCTKLMSANFSQTRDRRQDAPSISSRPRSTSGATARSRGSTAATMSEKELARVLERAVHADDPDLRRSGKVVVRLDGYYPPQRFEAVLDYAAGKLEAQQPLARIPARARARSRRARELHDEPFFLRPPYDLRRKPGAQAARRDVRDRRLRGLRRDAPRGFRRETYWTRSERFDVARFALGRGDAARHAATAARRPRRTWARELGVAYTPTVVFFDAAGVEVFRIGAYLRPFHFAASFAYVAERRLPRRAVVPALPSGARREACARGASASSSGGNGLLQPGRGNQRHRLQSDLLEPTFRFAHGHAFPNRRPRPRAAHVRVARRRVGGGGTRGASPPRLALDPRPGRAGGPDRGVPHPLRRARRRRNRRTPRLAVGRRQAGRAAPRAVLARLLRRSRSTSIAPRETRSGGQ